jgi:SAM-dependent methyltransferase
MLGFYGRQGAYGYFRCGGCGTIQLHPLPTQEELRDAYAKEYAVAAHIGADPDRRKREAGPHYEAIMRAFRQYRTGNEAAEVGAGWGGLAERLIGEGVEYHGVEPSEMMAAHCRAHGLPVCTGGIEALPEAAYSSLILCSVFEHLVEHDAWLQRANRLLRPGGIFITSQPTAPFLHFGAQIIRLGRKHVPLPKLHQGFCPPWHVVLFSIGGMETLVGRHGFDLVEVRPMPQGREGGITGMIQAALETVNAIGWRLMGTRWPLVIGHMFVFKKRH